MESIRVRDVMIPVGEYASIDGDKTLYDAIIVLAESNRARPAGRDAHRAVLVTDGSGRVIGKLGHLAFLKALEPKYNQVKDLDTLSRAGVSSEYIASIMENLSLWEDDLVNIGRRARAIRVRDVMHPAEQYIDEEEALQRAVHLLIMWQSVSLLVKRGEHVTGIIRLSDLYEKITHHLLQQD